MKTLKILSCLTWLVLAPVTYASISTIQHVELYPSGAMVTREVILEPQQVEDFSVEVGDLPSSLLPSSIQISANSANLRIGGFVFLPQENPVKKDDPRTAGLRAAVDGIDEKLRLNRLEQESIQARIQHHQGLTESIRKSLEEAASSEAYELAGKAWKALEAARNEGDERLAGLALESRELVIQREEAKKDLDELVNGLQATSGVLRFDVAGELSAGVRLLVRYQVREAGWAPVHEIRANPARGTLDWIYKARIWQRTGEDWSSVAASLNSASALNAAGLPDLPPWILQRIEPRPYLSSKARGVNDEAFLMQAPAMAMADAEMASPESTTTGFFIRLPQSLSLESGKEPAVREAFTGQLKADFWSEAVPELSTEAWLMAGMTNELGWPILAGESYCYIDGQLVARRQIGAMAAGEEIELALGRNEKITIERKERVRKESEGGLIDRTKRHEFKYETTVTNRMKVAHRVVLQDRFPIGRDNKIQVKIVAPKDVEPEEGTGLFKWERTIQPGGSDVMTTEYTIIYPAEWMLNTPM